VGKYLEYLDSTAIGTEYQSSFVSWD